MFPKAADYGVSKRAEKARKFITASGEEITSVDEYRVRGADEYGLKMNMKGRLTDVRKPLISAAGVEDKGNDTFISETGRYIIWKGSPAQAEIRQAVSRILHKHKFAKTSTLYKENSVYNFYLKVDTTPSDPASGPKEDALCPLAHDAPSSDLTSRPEEETCSPGSASSACPPRLKKEVCPLAKSTGSASSDSWKTIAGKKEVRKDMKSTKNGGQDSRP